MQEEEKIIFKRATESQRDDMLWFIHETFHEVLNQPFGTRVQFRVNSLPSSPGSVQVVQTLTV